jgi:hypothetical protein
MNLHSSIMIASMAPCFVPFATGFIIQSSQSFLDFKSPPLLCMRRVMLIFGPFLTKIVKQTYLQQGIIE